jgi:glutaredoxin
MPIKITPGKDWASLVLILCVVVGGSSAWSWWRETRAVQLIRQHNRPGRITMFTTSTCPYCAQAKAWLNERDISWRECNVELSAACQAAFESQGAPGVPLMQVGSHWRLGFDATWLSQALQAVPPTPMPNQARPSTPTSPRP